jgi:hypothetical protein
VQAFIDAVLGQGMLPGLDVAGALNAIADLADPMYFARHSQSNRFEAAGAGF